MTAEVKTMDDEHSLFHKGLLMNVAAHNDLDPEARIAIMLTTVGELLAMLGVGPHQLADREEWALENISMGHRQALEVLVEIKAEAE